MFSLRYKLDFPEEEEEDGEGGEFDLDEYEI